MKTFFQASWVNRQGTRVYSDIRERRDQVQMEVPAYALRALPGVRIVESHAENLTELRRSSAFVGASRSFFEPTPRGQR